jgi:hypothetical protein
VPRLLTPERREQLLATAAYSERLAMPMYKSKWTDQNDEIGIVEFFVADDPDPPAKWKCWYHVNHKGWMCDYWIVLPKMNRQMEAQYIRRKEVMDRDLTCAALNMTCELIMIKKIEVEPRRPALIKLAIQIEKSRAAIEEREPRKFLDVYAD